MTPSVRHRAIEIHYYYYHCYYYYCADLEEIKYVIKLIRSSLKNKQDNNFGLDQINLEKTFCTHSGQPATTFSTKLPIACLRSRLSIANISFEGP